MQKPFLPPNETERLSTLYHTGLLDSKNEVRFDRLTQLIKQCLHVEIALISLVDKDRQWFKSRQGLSACQTARDISFCGHAILGEDIFEIADAREDHRFKDNPLVVNAPYIVFYAGMPLSIAGHHIGTLCLIDSKPRELNETEKDILRQFASAVEQEIDDRLHEQALQQLAEKELSFRLVVEGTKIGTWEWNVQTGEAKFNERWAEIIGFSLADIEPLSISTWRNRVHPDDLELSLDLLQRHFNNDLDFYEHRYRMKHQNGGWVWVHDRGRVISWNEYGKPLMMYGTHADISDQKLAERQLLESRDQFKALVTNIPGVTFRCDAIGNNMIYMSEGIAELSGFPAYHFINNSLSKYTNIIHPDDRAAVKQVISKAIADKNSWIIHYRIVHKDGQTCTVEERGVAEYDESGIALYLDGLILDTSKETDLKNQLMKLTAQLPGVVYQYQQWPDGRAAFPYASAAIEKIYGLKPEQVTEDASLVFDLILKEDLPALSESIERSIQHLSLWQHEYRVHKPNNQVAWLSGRAMPEKQPDGSVLWHGYIYDSTETKHHYLALESANNMLQLAQQRLELSSKQAQIGYWQASLKTGYLWWSPMIYQLLGFDQTTIQPSVALFKSVLHPDDEKLVEEAEHFAKQTGCYDVTHRIIRSDGKVRWVHELAQMSPETENPDLMLIGSIQDVTERINLQRLKDDFISTVSHELRTPLTSINGALKLLCAYEHSNFTEQGQKLLEIANSNCDRLKHLINDILDIEKLIAGKMTFEYKTRLLLPILEKSLDDHTTFAYKSRIQLRLSVSEEAKLISIRVDEHRLQQILSNLLSNAIKFSHDGGEVQLQADVMENEIEIAVVDQGEGVPDHFKTNIFQRFAQADSSTSREKNGTGLGLALCKQLLEGMNGSIGFTSEAAGGSRFFIRLPR